MAEESLKQVVLDLWEQVDSQYPLCFYDADGDCARWVTCPLVMPECPRVRLCILAGIPMDVPVHSATPEIHRDL